MNRRLLDPFRTPRGNSAFLAPLLLLGGMSLIGTLSVFADPPATDASSLETGYHWTGQAGDSRWANPNNWKVGSEAGWVAAENPPPPGSQVVLGNAAPAAPQNLDLSYHVEIGRLVFANTDPQRSYTIRSWFDPHDTGIDSDSGMVYTLSLTDPTPLAQTPDSVGTLTIRIETSVAADGQPVVLLASRHGAVIMAERGLKSETGLDTRHPDAEANGKLKGPGLE